jgi:hypothetical protein
MANVNQVYWTRKSDAVGSFISGLCYPDNVPEYGEVNNRDLPTEISASIDENGVLTALSPPVFGKKNAFRYSLRITASERANLATENEISLDLKLATRVTEAPQGGASRDNWWSYAQHNFVGLPFNQKTPVSLMKKWKHGMLEIIFAEHPDKDKKLKEWDDRVARHNAYVKRSAAVKTPAHKKSHNDLVVIPSPVYFKSDEIKQIFRYNVEMGKSGKQAKHSIRIAMTAYTIPHGPAMTFKDGVAPSENMSVQIRLAMCLLAWSEAPTDSAHAILNGHRKFEGLCKEIFTEMTEFFQETHNPRSESEIKANTKAAISALSDFGKPNVPIDSSQMQIDACAKVKTEIEKALLQLKSANPYSG